MKYEMKNKTVEKAKRLVWWGSSFIDPRIQLIEEPRRGGKYRCSQLIWIFQKLLPTKFSKVSGDAIDIFSRKKYKNCVYFLNISAPKAQMLDGYCEEHKLMTVYERIPERIRSLLQRGECTLVLEAANEGHLFSIPYAMAIHHLIDRIGCQTQQVVYATQNHFYLDKYNDWCNCNNISKNNRFRVVVTHVNLILMVIKYGLAKKKIWSLDEKKSLSRLRPQKWLCLNNIPRGHRTFLLYRMLERNLIQEGSFSFNHKLSSGITDLSSLTEEIKAFLPLETTESILEIIHELDKGLPMHLDLGDRSLVNSMGRGDVLEIEKSLYANSYFSIVTESDFPQENGSLRFTEKALKPLLGMHPFLVFGSPGVLGLIRNLGFRTFDNFVDESYDSIRNPSERFDFIFEQIEYLCSLTAEELHERYSASFETLTYNYTHFLNYMPDWGRKHILNDFLPILQQKY
jgi:hypothetical protein